MKNCLPVCACYAPLSCSYVEFDAHDEIQSLFVVMKVLCPNLSYYYYSYWSWQILHCSLEMNWYSVASSHMVSFYLICILNMMNANFFLFFMHRSGGLCSSSLTYTNSQLPSGLRGPGQVCLRAVIEESVGAQQQVPSVSIVLGATLASAGHKQAVRLEDQLVK